MDDHLDLRWDVNKLLALVPPNRFHRGAIDWPFRGGTVVYPWEEANSRSIALLDGPSKEHRRPIGFLSIGQIAARGTTDDRSINESEMFCVNNRQAVIFSLAVVPSLRSSLLAASLSAGATGFRAGFAAGIVLVLLAFLSTPLASLSTQRHHGCRHRPLASFDRIASAADIGAIQAQFDALLVSGFIHAPCRAGQTGSAAIAAIFAIATASFAALFISSLRGETKCCHRGHGGGALHHQLSTLHTQVS
jgi:hypothetical protein